MGHRTVKRVPLDFEAKVGQVWPGYMPPSYRPCPSDDCDNGSKLAAAWLGHITHLILMLAEEPRRDEMHPWLRDLPLRPDKPPKANVTELTGGLSGRSPRMPFGHDGSDRWSATKAIIKAAGLPDDWGTCPVCQGHAIHPDDLAASESWEPTDPPKGEGWQLWETTSEGSPVSPVFSTADSLADWCADNATWFADLSWTADEWLATFRDNSTDAQSLLLVRLPAEEEA